MNTIKKLMKEYSYGKTHLLDENIKIKIKENNSGITITPFYRYHKNVRSGTCDELAASIYFNICDMKKPHAIIAYGNEPKLFKDRNKIGHTFVLVSENRDIFGSRRTLSAETIENTKPVVIDPTFQKMIPFRDSGYYFHSRADFSTHEEALSLEDRNAVPLGIDQRRFIGLSADCLNPEYLEIIILNNKGKTIWKNLGDVYLEKNIENKKLLDLIKYIHEKNPARIK